MSWVLIVIIFGASPSVSTSRFPNKVSCDADRIWIEAGVRSEHVKTVCLQDIEEYPSDNDAHSAPAIPEPESSR